MGILETIVLISLCGAADWLQGNKVAILGKGWAGVQGAVIAYLLGAPGLVIASFAALWGLGAAFRWETPLGSVLERREQDPSNREWWQIWGLQNPGNEVLALAVRGALWGVCLIPLMYFDPKYLMMIPVMVVLLPASAMLARAPEGQVPDYEVRGLSEVIRGLLAGSAAYLIGALT